MKDISKFIAGVLVIVALSAGFAVAQTKRKKPAAKPVAKERPMGAFKIADQTVTFTPGPKDADGWIVYESKEDLFKLAFPPTPVVTEEAGEDGKKSGNRYYNPEPVTPARINLTMAVTDLGATVGTDGRKRELYDAWTESLISADNSGTKAVKASDKEFAVAGSFGIEVSIDRGDYRFHGRAIIVNDKLYQIAAGSVAPIASKPEEYAEVMKWVRKFFDSFQYVPLPPPPVDPMKGVIENGVYRNDLVGYSMEVPAGWILQESKQSEETKRLALELLKNKDPQINKLLAAESAKDRYVFRFNKKEPGSPGNAGFTSSVRKLPGKGLTLEAVVLSTRQTVNQSKLDGNMAPAKYIYFGKVRAAMMDGAYNLYEMNIKQKTYIILHKGYSISFVLTYMDAADIDEIEKVMQTLTFK